MAGVSGQGRVRWADDRRNGDETEVDAGLQSRKYYVGKWVELDAGDSPRGVRGGSGDRAPEAGRGDRLPSGGISCVRPLVLA